MFPEFEQAATVFAAEGLNVSRETYGSLQKYAEFLVSYNEKVNLTAVTDGSEIFRKHFLDSLLLLQKAPGCFPEGSAVLDIGSGAGFPGVPLALVRRDLRMTLLDSLQKRITFLEQLCSLLEVKCRALHGRAELLAKTELRESFDTVTARAVAALPTLTEYSLPYVKTGGYWLAMKGPGEEIKPALQAIQLLGGELTETIPYTLPGGDERVIYVVKKCTATPTKYPRNSSQIKQKPL